MSTTLPAWTLVSNVAFAPAAKTAASGSAARSATIEESAHISAAKGGDASAFKVLVDRYRDRTFALALRLAGNRESAEEIAQDAFVRAWQALPDFRGDSRFSTWLYRITYRRALDERASLTRRRDRETVLDTADLERAAAPRERAPDWGTRLHLERLVRALPDSQRACVTLFYVGDQSVEEIARILDVPSGTVKTHLFRARQELRAGMSGERSDGVGNAS